MPIVIAALATFLLLWIGYDYEQAEIKAAKARCAASDAVLVYTKDRQLLCISNRAVVHSK